MLIVPSTRDMKRVAVTSQIQAVCLLFTPRRGALAVIVVIGTGAFTTTYTMMT